ncbi:hypothetical protein Tco_1339316, partial [Tanacetum coccineum]
MAESAKRHEENSNIIKYIRASTDAAIRNQGASIKTLEIQIGQMSKVLQERGFRSLPSSTETNLRDQGIQHRSIFSETVPFPRRLQNFGCDDLREAQDVKILDAYDYTLPQKEKDSGSFTLPCFIHNICFDKAFVDLGDTYEIYGRLDDVQSERQMGRFMDASDLACTEVMALRTQMVAQQSEIKKLWEADRRRQTQFTETLKLMEIIQIQLTALQSRQG